MPLTHLPNGHWCSSTHYLHLPPDILFTSFLLSNYFSSPTFSLSFLSHSLTRSSFSFPFWSSLSLTCSPRPHIPSPSLIFILSHIPLPSLTHLSFPFPLSPPPPLTLSHPPIFSFSLTFLFSPSSTPSHSLTLSFPFSLTSLCSWEQ